jgi:hypothetical protein
LRQAYLQWSCGRPLRPHVVWSSDDIIADELVENLDKDRVFLKSGGVFDDDFIDSFIDLKMTEVERFEMTPRPVEFDMYYSQ